MAEHNAIIKDNVIKEADALNEVSKLRGKIVVEEVKEQDESNDFIRGHGRECKNESKQWLITTNQRTKCK